MRIQRPMLVGVVVLSLCVSSLARAQDDGENEGPPPQALLGHGVLDFAAALFNKIATQRGNIVFAPYEIVSAFYLASQGARGSTYEQMAKTFGWPTDSKVLHEAFSLVSADIKPAGSNSVWKVTNRRWAGKGLKLDPLTEMDDIPSLHLDTDPVDASSTKKLGESLTAFMKSQTDQHLTKVLEPEAPLTDSRLLIARAIRFAAPWARQGHKSNKGKGQMLKKQATMYFGETPDYKVAEMELNTEHTNLFILLPKAAGTQLNVSPDGATLRNIIADLQPTEIAVEMPIFHLTQHTDLTAALQALGVEAAFKDANFSEWGAGLKIADVQQTVDVSVDAEGEDMSVGTYVRLGKSHAKAAKPGKGAKRIERPFLFILRDAYWNVPLLFGRVEAL